MALEHFILYIIVFLYGIIIGSFLNVCIYRMPKGESVVTVGSHCMNCKHPLKWYDLFPVFSYIFLGGKCRYCKQKIRPRYLILETLSGCAFVLLAYTLNINVYTVTFVKAIPLMFMALYFTAVVLIAAIDKEYRSINKKVLAYGICISLLYMIYLYVIESNSIYRYAIYLAIYIILLSISTFILRRFAKDDYYIDLLLYYTIMLMFMDGIISIFTLSLFIVEVLLHIIIRKITKNKNGNIPIKFEKIPLGFYLGASNILVIFMMCMANLFR